ncbi:hypothetical protein NE562_12295 [Butyricicoccus faecihominis]|nr:MULTISPECIES: hypothetical protein [Butyricicoccaceae]MCQ5130444.1 hypothetical protein [Butyricicoccus faecihominis]WNX84908.1 hypothetical protein RWV98_01155 [Agathobaculum sp. NTUH-O15-33]
MNRKIKEVYEIAPPETGVPAALFFYQKARMLYFFRLCGSTIKTS